MPLVRSRRWGRGGHPRAGLAVVATAGVLIVRYALAGTSRTSRTDRARILSGVAELVRAIRGRR